ncbi:MAG: D-aminoacyl-tRNA deacylase [Polaribacter sp. SA4-10]|jgi:D-tyrosyl-tRNA(Tyr) deacylase|nr:MAG: D-aminoacyl-tRNA deacylase [Polaribacter sp. SA4-10]|tara:strand:- start:7138 stop:7590 length:453 start_codon:yes stop_codon:yes gene_type:complete
MKVVLQRVSKASVVINDRQIASIQHGLLLFVGIVADDTQEDIDWLVRKISNLRIFNDADHVMNNSLIDSDGQVLVVSQFTLHATTKKGNRPSYIKAAKPDIAIPIYENFITTLSLTIGKKVQTGVFGADMKVSLLNDGPVTIIIDSKDKI